VYILGLSTMTESAACLMRDGEVLAAAEEERFSRIKHDGGFPYASIAYVLGSQGLSLADVDHVAVYWNPYNLGFRLRWLTAMLLAHPAMFLEKLRRVGEVWRGAAGDDSGWSTMFRTRQKLRDRFGVAPARVHFLDHHACHMASCFFASRFPESAILVMDGAGEAACTTWGAGRDGSFEKLDEHRLPHSLGHYYSAVTGYLGFKMLDGEYKLMGLSAYGGRGGIRWIRENFLRSVGPGRYALETPSLDYHRALRGTFRGAFVDHFGPPRAAGEHAAIEDRHLDVAGSVQGAFEEVVLDMAKELRRRTGLDRLSVAGGCGLNCVATGKILGQGIFEEVYVPPVPHDSGGSLGAAMLLYNQLTGARPDPIDHAHFGPEYGDAEIEAALAARDDTQWEKLDEGALVDRAAERLAAGDLLCWMQGRMEFGPRALGNRSFLADPRSEDVTERMNQKIKKREPFRPFAPSVKAEKASEYFEIGQPSPFMTIIVPVRPERRGSIPAVVHEDGSARPQTVERSANPRYWSLLDRFEARTGVPVLLNTSFNIQEPIVCTPEEAIATFARSGVDALAIGNFWVTHRC
jgi:carbamoyltransferase